MPRAKPQGPSKPRAGAEVTVRPYSHAWVCPTTDHANHSRETACGRCGAPLTDGRIECREAP